MSHIDIDSNNTNDQLSEDIIIYLNSNITKKEESLLLTLYKYQRIQHKQLATILGIQPNGLSNLLKKINQTNVNLIDCKKEGRNKLYSLSQIAKKYTEKELMPKETTRKQALTSFLCTDPSIQDVMESLRKFQESGGDDWYIILDDLILAESMDKSKTKDNPNANLEGEAYQNYINFINAMIALIIHDGQQATQKVYEMLGEKILIKRLESLLSNLLDDYYQIKPLFLKEKESLQEAYDIIDMIFSKRYPAIFGTYSKRLPKEYYGVDRAISIMINEFKDNNYNQNVSIAKWKRKFYTEEHFSCIYYIALKCNAIYIGQEKPFS